MAIAPARALWLVQTPAGVTALSFGDRAIECEHCIVLVERRRSALPLELLTRVALSWSVVAGLLVAVSWTAIEGMIAVELESLASLTLPLLLLGCAMLLAARIAWRLLGDEEATLAALIAALSIPVLLQVMPMRIDHHGWQIVCALAVVNALMSRRPVLGGWAIGAIGAIWLTISLEGLAVTLAMLGVLGLRWMRDRNSRVWLVSALQALAVASSLFFVVQQAFGEVGSSCGTLGPVHLGVFAWAAVWSTLIARFEPLPAGLRLGGLTVAGAGAVAIWFYAAPQCSAGTWTPVWSESVMMMLQIAVTPVIGILAAINLSHTSRDWLRRFWGDYAIILATAFAFAALHSQAALVACALAAPPLAWQVREWLRRIRQIKRFGPRLGATIVLACALLPAFPVIVLNAAAAV